MKYTLLIAGKCVAVCCSVKCVAACCSVLQRVAACCSVKCVKCVAVFCIVLQRVDHLLFVDMKYTLLVSEGKCVAVCCR